MNYVSGSILFDFYIQNVKDGIKNQIERLHFVNTHNGERRSYHLGGKHIPQIELRSQDYISRTICIVIEEMLTVCRGTIC